MPQEIERKFLVKGDLWRQNATPVHCRQNYIPTSNQVTVRARIIDNHAFITIKGPAKGISRLEFEYEIPIEDAKKILDELCPALPIEKTRYKVPYQDHIWVVDEFLGQNQGLILAEIELTHPDQPIGLPPWTDREVSTDYHYHNAYLARVPFNTWPAEAD